MTRQRLLSQKQYADHLGISRQAVNRMIHTGKIPSRHGRVNLEESDAALAEALGSNGGTSLAEAIRRKETALAGLRELELRTKQGLLISLSDMSSSLCQHNRVIRNNLLRLPRTLAGRLPAETRSLVLAVSEAEVERVLNELSATISELIDLEKFPLCENCQRILRGGSETLEESHERPQ